MLKVFVSAQSLLARLHRDDRGATAVEYGLIVALIAAVVVTAAGLLGNQISTVFTDVTTGMHLP